MTIAIAAAKPHTDAVVARLEAAGLLVGRGKQPDGSGWQGEEGTSVFRPYVVLFPFTGTPDGNEAESLEYLDYKLQASVIAATQDGAESAADIVKTTLVGQRLDVPGRASYRGQLLVDRPAARDDVLTPPLHYVVLQIGFRTQPA